MKRFLPLCILFIGYSSMNAQISQGNVIFDFSGGYTQTSNELGVPIHYYVTKKTSFDFSVSDGYMINDNILIGGGLVYVKEKEDRAQVTLNTFFDTIQGVSYFGTTIKTRGIGPSFHIKYFKEISNKIYFGLGINSNLLFMKIIAPELLRGDNDPMFYDETHKPTYQIGTKYIYYKLLSISLIPSFEYLITKHIGCSLRFSGIQYISNDFKKGVWNISLNPYAWNFGLYLRLGEEKPE
ncbi:MAG: hypothetical protein WHT29_06995 [Bacteroidales bacterium]